MIRFAQDIYFAEFDGPQLRTYYIEVMGEMKLEAVNSVKIEFAAFLGGKT